MSWAHQRENLLRDICWHEGNGKDLGKGEKVARSTQCKDKASSLRSCHCRERTKWEEQVEGTSVVVANKDFDGELCGGARRAAPRVCITCRGREGDHRRRRRPTRVFPLTIMAEPTKQQTEQVFKILRSQKANKVRCCTQGDFGRPNDGAGLLRLQCAQSDVVQRHLWRLHLPGLLQQPSQHGRTHLLR